MARSLTLTFGLAVLGALLLAVGASVSGVSPVRVASAATCSPQPYPPGDVERTIVSGMKAERMNPREIEGRQALFVVNLKPRKMKGILSEGMVFDIGYADGVVPVLAVPEGAVPDGARAG